MRNRPSPLASIHASPPIPPPYAFQFAVAGSSASRHRSRPGPPGWNDASDAGPRRTRVGSEEAAFLSSSMFLVLDVPREFVFLAAAATPTRQSSWTSAEGWACELTKRSSAASGDHAAGLARSAPACVIWAARPPRTSHA